MEKLEQKYLSTPQFAKMFGISRQYVHKMILDGKIKAIKIGNVYRIPMEEVEKVEKDGV